MTDSFKNMLDRVRSIADTQSRKGQLFERVMKRYFQIDRIYQDRFTNVWLWSEWCEHHPDFSGPDIGIDLVAEERDGGYCAIQCKCYAADARLSKSDLDSFVSASAREPFVSRILIHTGSELGANAVKVIQGLTSPCSILYSSDLAVRPINWPDLVQKKPEDLVRRGGEFNLRKHQKEALDDVVAGFNKHVRGKLIMACGTGKTFTALRIAEMIAGEGGRVLYLVPSISLFQQSMREWAEHRLTRQTYIGICSDTRAGQDSEDASLCELEIPVTTDATQLLKVLSEDRRESMTVVFCTYQSLGLVEQAQNDGALNFNLVICDEAHRTTGVERPDDRTSPFVLVHDENRIRADRRLYMTATPRIYTEGAKAKAANYSVEVFSMDDEQTFGPEFHRLQFSQAIAQNLLTDYKVIIFAITESNVNAELQRHLATIENEIKISDAARIIGCWRALQNPENKEGSVQPLSRAIAFSNTILSSKRLEEYWSRVVGLVHNDEEQAEFQCDVRHVDGKHHALNRKNRIDWLKGSEDGACRILTNARCLSEGIDVPALDAVLFMAPRNSPVDVVQAVGRAMRKAEGKSYGYIILPVVVPAGVDPAVALDDNERFAPVWSVLRALRSHDDRFNAEINRIDLNESASERILYIFDEEQETANLPFPPLNLPSDALYAQIVEKCGDRKYWETWAKDVADIFTTLVHRISEMLDNREENGTLIEWFEAFHEELKKSINDSITLKSAIDMMAQHILTRPVFEALFEGYDFAAKNPVAKALDQLRGDFGEFGLENETRDLERFYESVRFRAMGLDNSAARQRLLMELYEKFFATAMKKEADRLGIVYTPVEIVDFILHSADHVLRKEFDRTLSDAGVHVLDPFTGTGIFLVRLLQSSLIRDEDLLRKFREELHANELVLLAYYIAAIHIEEAYHGRIGLDREYEPFSGIVLTDTFNLHTERTGFPMDWLPQNSERAKRQQNSPIQVIVGNPPWSVGQRSSADNNPNVDYPKLEQRVTETYVSRSTATLKNSLYDTYKMAIRWASDRIGEEGIVAFVTNGSWLDSNAASGVRACLAEEFTSIHVLNLRGNQRTQGERSRKEGGKVFGSGSRAPVAITLLVKNPAVEYKGCRILYRDIGDYLSRENKLRMLSDWSSIASIENWEKITPDRHHDWIDQRDETFSALYPLCSKEVKAGRSGNAVFQLFSNGYQTGRDSYTYSFGHDDCAKNAKAMICNYQGALNKLKQSRDATLNIKNIVSHYSSNLLWDEDLKRNLRQRKEVVYSLRRVWKVQYRPFVKQYCYIDYVLAQRKSQQDSIFPTHNAKNCAICVPGIGSTKPFSILVVDKMPDRGFVSAAQCFPRYRFEHSIVSGNQRNLPGITPPRSQTGGMDNITDTALHIFRDHYNDQGISKDHIFDYVYGILHAPAYRERFANSLVKELPRIPLATDFHAFADAGHRLVELHLGYETCSEFPLQLNLTNNQNLDDFRIGMKAMRFKDTEKTVLCIDDQVHLKGIPQEAHQYQVNGRTPIEWFIDRYRIVQDRQSGIINDPNGWFNNLDDLISAFRRIVFVSVETVNIVASLPHPFSDS